MIKRKELESKSIDEQSHGIHSVNLSVGYRNEHTEGKHLDVHVTHQAYP